MRRYLRFWPLVLAVIILVLMAMFIVSLKFRLTGTNAQRGSIASSSSFIELKFNQEISGNFDKSTNNISFVPEDMLQSISVEGKSMKFFIESPSEKDKFEIKIDTINSIKNETILNFHKVFNVRYVPYKNLSSAEKSNQIKANDPAETKYPIINSLPITTDKYTIDYSGIKDDKLVLIVDVVGVNQLNLNDPDTKSYLQAIRDSAMKDLSNKGYDLSTFTITYQEDIENLTYPEPVPRD